MFWQHSAGSEMMNSSLNGECSAFSLAEMICAQTIELNAVPTCWPDEQADRLIGEQSIGEQCNPISNSFTGPAGIHIYSTEAWPSLP